jgi:hypothetical protein
MSCASLIPVAPDELATLLLVERPTTLAEVDALFAKWRKNVVRSATAAESSGSGARGSGLADRPDAAVQAEPGTSSDSFEEIQQPRTSTVPPRRLPHKKAEWLMYVVTRCPKGREDSLGVWKVPWRTLAMELALPHSSLTGSGFHVKGQMTLQASQAYWRQEGWAGPAPRIQGFA